MAHVEDGKEQQNYTSQKYYDYSIDQVIIDMAHEGHTHVEIGKAVGRNAYAISLRLRTLDGIIPTKIKRLHAIAIGLHA